MLQLCLEGSYGKTPTAAIAVMVGHSPANGFQTARVCRDSILLKSVVFMLDWPQKISQHLKAL